MTKTITIKKMAIVSLMTAILCILSPISVPVFISPVPISLGVLAIYLTAYVLEPVEALISVVIFLLLGVFGLPVFSGYSGGIGKILGPTGGYIIGMIIGLGICYFLGTMWFSLQQGKGFIASLLLCVVPFLIGDAIKIAIAAIIGPEISKRLNKANI